MRAIYAIECGKAWLGEGGRLGYVLNYLKMH
jgi:hypothetical protein